MSDDKEIVVEDLKEVNPSRPDCQSDSFLSRIISLLDGRVLGDVELCNMSSADSPRTDPGGVRPGGPPSLSLKRVSAKYKNTTMKRLVIEVENACQKYGEEKLLFGTLTFDENFPAFDYVECRRRYRSWRTWFVKTYHFPFIECVERSDSGRLHFHILAFVPVDVQTGFDHRPVYSPRGRRIYPSACKWLRDFWKEQRRASASHGFGKWNEWKPLKTRGTAAARYVSKYVSKSIGNCGGRSWSMSRNWPKYFLGRFEFIHWNEKFSCYGPKSVWWRFLKIMFSTRDGSGNLVSPSAEFLWETWRKILSKVSNAAYPLNDRLPDFWGEVQNEINQQSRCVVGTVCWESYQTSSLEGGLADSSVGGDLPSAAGWLDYSWGRNPAYG